MTDEEKLLVRRAYDKADEAEKYWRVTATRFLSPAEGAYLEKELAYSPIPHLFDGGYENAERRLCLFLPPHLSPADGVPEESPLRILRIDNTARAALSHRDYLGALLSLGITRDVLGDILVVGNRAYLFCLEEILPYLLLNFVRAGNAVLSLAEVSRAEIELPEEKGTMREGTVSALRLDALTALAFRISREEAKRALSASLVTLNHLPALRPDAELSEGDLISLRGHGRARLLKIGGESRKGRIFVSLLLNT